MEYFISDITGRHVATIIADSEAAIDAVVDERFCTNDFFGSYTPAFGAVDGLIENQDAEVIYT